MSEEKMKTWNQRWCCYSHVDKKITIGANSSLNAAYIITVNSVVARDFLGNDKAIQKHLSRWDEQGSKSIYNNHQILKD